MEIHNRMEEAVIKTVNELFNIEDSSKKLDFCTCYQCRLDVSCYVLNRINPEYVLSSRGVAHGEQDYNKNIQRDADIVRLVQEGWKKINQTRRPHFGHGQSNHDIQNIKDGPAFNFPTIIGKIYNGTNFAPLSDLTISLINGSELVKMIDPNWQNPCPLVSSTAGTYIFWPEPVSASSVDEEKTFSFEISATLKGYEEMHHFFELSLKSEANAIKGFSHQRTYKVQDLYLFPK